MQVGHVNQVLGRSNGLGPNRWRLGAAALLMAVILALPLSSGHAADDSEPTPAQELIAATYDVIIVPRPGSRTPRVLTERGWRSLNPRMPQRREAGAYQRRLYADRWSGRAGRPPAAGYGRIPYDARADWPSRRSQAWQQPETWQPQRTPWPDSRQRGWNGWQSGGYARAY